MIFLKVCINFSPVLRRWEEGRGEVGGFVEVGREEEKPAQVKTRGDQLPTDGPDHAYNQADGTSFRSRVEFQADNAQLVRSTGANESVMVLQGCKTSHQKSRSLEFGHRRYGVWLAIEYSYKLGQNNEFKF